MTDYLDHDAGVRDLVFVDTLQNQNQLQSDITKS
jgi:hypothetical protein